MVKIYLDDCRMEPEGYLLARNPRDFCNIVHAYIGDIEVISFDHDLGEKESARKDEEGNIQHDKEISGYDLLVRTIQTHKVLGKKFPLVTLHTANPVGYNRMHTCLEYSNLIDNLVK